MLEYQLAKNAYIYPTPAGAYYAITHQQLDAARSFLIALMQRAASPELTEENLCQLSGLELPEALALLEQLQRSGFLQALSQPLQAMQKTLEEALPELLKNLSGNQKALLADDNGFYLSSHGFHHESAEELAGLAAELSKLQARYTGLLAGNLNYQSAAMGVINAAGHSEIGFWPMHIGQQHFMLVLSGTPQLNSQYLVELVWLMISRYGLSKK